MGRLAIVGDLHGRIDIMLEKVEADVIIQLGDFGTFVDIERMDSATRRHQGIGDFPDYYSLKKHFDLPVNFIKGNHEDFDVIEEIMEGCVPNLRYLENGMVYDFGFKIGVVGGNYSPVRYGLKKNHPKLQQSRRRHFNYQDVESLVKQGDIDIIISHDCPRGVGIYDRKGEECGASELNYLIERVKPKMFFHGHYHRYSEALLGDTKVICLDKIDGGPQSIFYLDT